MQGIVTEFPFMEHFSSTGPTVLLTKEKFVAALKQDEDGTFPIARKLVDLAKYYGFDGYFINQETTGDLVTPLGEKNASIHALYKRICGKVNHPIKYAWYDAMTYKYGRYHEDGLGDYNYQFMQKKVTRSCGSILCQFQLE